MRKQKLIQRLSPVSRAESERTLASVSSSLFEAIDSPRSLAAYILLREKEYAQLVSLPINPSNYQCAERFADDYLATKLLSKYPNFSHEDLDPKGEAIASFKKFEETCRLTNIRFKEMKEDPNKRDPSMYGILLRARRKISSILGEPNLDSISAGFGWGPGATTSTSGHHTSAYIKFQSRLDVTSDSLVMGWCCVNSTPSWVNCQLQTDSFPGVEAYLTEEAFNIVRGNEIVFVPKNAKTHRVIAKEPHVNSYLQKGFGSYIRKRLRDAVGIDLKDQSLNQRLAKSGSLDGSLATIDLSGASDTISTELVRFLLPSSWFGLLNQIRSKQGYLREEKTWIHYHKFSSMGNACTFELESLIFYAICKACMEVNGGAQTISVYGDDIIVPTEHYESVAKVISYCGFTVNESKSFHSGPFRESCGKDYFLGVDVRPIFLKEAISNVESLYKVANAIRRYAHRRNNHCGCDVRLRRTWAMVVDLVPKDLRYKIPEGFGDSGLIVNFDEAMPSLIRSDAGWGGYLFKAITRHPAKLEMRDRHGGYTATLSATGDGSVCLETVRSKRVNRFTGEFPLRDFIDSQFSESSPLLGHHDLRKMTEPRVTRIHTHGWCDLGPWKRPAGPG